MSSERYSKVVQVSFVAVSFIVGLTVRVIFEFFAVVSGAAAKIYAIEPVRHGVPVACGIGLFLFLQFNPKTRKWLEEVVTEIDKVVWPGKKDTLSMTAVVCIILIVSGMVLGLLDLSAGTVMRFIMN